MCAGQNTAILLILFLSLEETSAVFFAMKKKRTLTLVCSLNLREHLNDWGARRS